LNIVTASVGQEIQHKKVETRKSFEIFIEKAFDFGRSGNQDIDERRSFVRNGV